jgi:hypothetical protein
VDIRDLEGDLRRAPVADEAGDSCWEVVPLHVGDEHVVPAVDTRQRP